MKILERLIMSQDCIIKGRKDIEQIRTGVMEDIIIRDKTLFANQMMICALVSQKGNDSL